MINWNNLSYLWAALVVGTLVFFVFKHFYSYPNMVMDPYVFIKAAVMHMGVNSSPIYSSLCFIFSPGSTANLMR